LLAVPLSILTKSRERVLREKRAKTVEFKRKFGICFNCQPIQKDQKSRKSSGILENFEIAESFRQIAIDFCSIGGKAASRPGNTVGYTYSS
jgi:hypothetical protein